MVFYQEKYNKASTFGERVGNVKSICAEISGIHPEEKIKEPCVRHYLIRGLKKEYGPFVTSIQGWPQQPLSKNWRTCFLIKNL